MKFNSLLWSFSFLTSQFFVFVSEHISSSASSYLYRMEFDLLLRTFPISPANYYEWLNSGLFNISRYTLQPMKWPNITIKDYFLVIIIDILNIISRQTKTVEWFTLLWHSFLIWNFINILRLQESKQLQSHRFLFYQVIELEFKFELHIHRYELGCSKDLYAVRKITEVRKRGSSFFSP